ncbi:MAG: tetratricopeptide repeat protein [Porticoccaceae bacterium]|nr:tetratricopeptide repeat protein [Porticoccaceae bacterium]
MAEYSSEEEQIEALKRWWGEYGNRVMLALALVFCSYFSWQYVDQQKRESAEKASLEYAELLEMLDRQPLGTDLDKASGEDVLAAAQILKADYGNSVYGQFAALAAARIAVEQGDLDSAAVELQWLLDHNPDEVKERVVSLRLARVEAARGNLDVALGLVQGVDPGALKSMYEEAKGDFYVQQGNPAAAFTAYQAAVASNGSRDNVIITVLQMKLDQVTASAEQAPLGDQTGSTDESSPVEQTPADSAVDEILTEGADAAQTKP